MGRSKWITKGETAFGACCPFCERVFIGSLNQTKKIMELHLKKSHDVAGKINGEIRTVFEKEIRTGKIININKDETGLLKKEMTDSEINEICKEFYGKLSQNPIPKIL